MARLASILLAGSCIAAPAWAQDDTGDAPPPIATETGEQSVGRVYSPSDFARFSPTTALDMVNQIPGFTIDSGDDRRGLGQGGANVLINGERISGKSNDAISELRRISASDVTRIEIRDAATLDIPGLSGQVVNVVADIDNFSGTFSWQPEFRARITDPRPYTGEIAVSGSTGPFEYSLSLSNNSNSFRGGGRGPEFVYDGAGQLIDLRQETVTNSGDQPKLAGSVKIDGPGSSIGNLNASYSRYYFTADETGFRNFPGTVDRSRFFLQTERERRYEIGGDYEFALGPGRFKIIGLRSEEYSPEIQSAVTDFADGSPSSGSRFEQYGDEAETILRGEYSFRWAGDWQIALEGARNVLDIESHFFDLDPDGVFREVPLPDATAVVDEDRAEVNLTYGRPLADNLTIQTSLGAEYSKLSQTGAGGLTRTFYRPKGFVSAAWEPDEGLTINARIEREVGQLNFSDFVANVNVSVDNENASNPDLVPPQSWNAEIEATRTMGAWGSVTAKLFYEAISDIVDQIPIGLTGEAPGNLDRARRYGIDLNGTVNFDPIGWHGAKLDFEFGIQRSQLTDPLTGESRPISYDRRISYEFDFRHDIPGSDWAYGAFAEFYREGTAYRLNDLQYFRNDRPLVGVFVENKDVFGLRVRAGLYNLTGVNDVFTRTAYVDRRDGPVAFIEDRSRDFGPIFNFQINGSF